MVAMIPMATASAIPAEFHARGFWAFIPDSRGASYGFRSMPLIISARQGEPNADRRSLTARLPLPSNSEQPGLRPVSRRHTRLINERRGWLRWTGSTPPLSAVAVAEKPPPAYTSEKWHGE